MAFKKMFLFFWINFEGCYFITRKMTQILKNQHTILSVNFTKKFQMD